MPQTTATVGVRYMIDDVADAIAFYTTHLGFTVEQDAAPAFAAVSRDGVRLLLSGPTSSGRRAMPDGTWPVLPAAGTASTYRSPTWPARSTAPRRRLQVPQRHHHRTVAPRSCWRTSGNMVELFQPAR